MTHWAIDLGTSSTGIARWDATQQRPAIVHLPRIARPLDHARPLEHTGMVPSMVQMLPSDLARRVGDWGWLRRNAFIGRQAEIGCVAQENNDALPRPSFTPSFKSALAREPTRTLARLGKEAFSARDVARAFFRELLREVHAETKERIRELVFTAPIASYDAYRAELRDLALHAGVRSVRFVDEPIAAAMGYGVSIGGGRRVLVFDMGGGTMHAALVHLDRRGAERGSCEVLAKEGRAVGGNLVDRWLFEDAMREIGVALVDDTSDDNEALWQRLMLAEARRVKEAVHTRPAETLITILPEELRGMRARLIDRPTSVEITQDRLRALLEARGLYALIAEIVGAVASGSIDEVLLVGGSTLLPGIFGWFEAKFGRDRVRAWQPFDAVVLGAAAYAGGAFTQSDFLVHDYAIVTHDPKTGAPQHTVVVPSGTRFPTPPHFWRRQLVPTCALGEPETLFKLVICEIGRHGDDKKRFGWDASGTLHPLGAPGAQDVVVRLNEANPTLGTLDPPHSPSDKKPRLDVSFGVSADRWLIVTVRDLATKKLLFEDEPVVRLL